MDLSKANSKQVVLFSLSKNHVLRDDTFSSARDYPFSTYAKFSKKTLSLTPDTGRYVAYQGVRNVSFSENVVYVPNG